MKAHISWPVPMSWMSSSTPLLRAAGGRAHVDGVEHAAVGAHQHDAVALAHVARLGPVAELVIGAVAVGGAAGRLMGVGE